MDIKIFRCKLNIVKARYNHAMEPLIKICKQFIGLDAKIPQGEYRGRWGKIISVSIDGNGDACGVIIPYRLNNKKVNDGFISDSRPDVRTFWGLSEIESIRLPRDDTTEGLENDNN